MSATRAILAGLALTLASAAAPPPSPGDTVELEVSYRSRSSDTAGGRSSAHGSTSLYERVVAVRGDGVELSYDLPPGTVRDERAREWQLPAHVLRAADGRMTLLNAAELANRRDRWLQRGKVPAALCGRLVFTWTAVRIECDPQAVLTTIAAHRLEPTVPVVGQAVTDPDASAPAELTRRDADEMLVASFALDSARIRRAAAETDVAVAELSGQPIALERALRAHEADAITGTIDVTIAVGPDGRALRRTRLVRLTIARPGHPTETREREEAIARRPIVASAAQP